MSKEVGKHRRQIKRAYLVAPPSGMAIKTRIVPTEPEKLALRAIADHFGRLAGADLVRAQKTGLEAISWPVRKRLLSDESSSRWAGTISRGTNDQVSLAQRSQAAHRDELARTIAAIERKLAVRVAKTARVAVGSRTSAVPGYHDQDEHYRKRQRLPILKGELARVEADPASGKVRLVRGGKRLFKTGQNLEAAGLSAEQYHQLSSSARHKFGAHGSHLDIDSTLVVPHGAAPSFR